MELTKDRIQSAEQQAIRSSGVIAWSRILPFLFPLVAIGLKLFRLDYQSLWYDEAFGVYLAKLDLVSLTQHTAGDIHPPLYYYLLHFWIKVVGSGELAVRYFSVLFGVLLVAMVYRFTLRLLGNDSRFIASLAAGVIAISPFQLWYSQETRMYTLAAVLGLAATWFLLDMLDLLPRRAQQIDTETQRTNRHCPTIWGWIGYVVVATASLYLLYYAAFLLVFLNLFALGAIVALGRSQPTFKGRLIAWLSAQVAVLVLYLPWLPVALRQTISPAVPPWRHFIDLPTVLIDSWSAFSLGQSIEQQAMWGFLLLFLLVYGAGVTYLARRPLVAALLLGSVWAPIGIIYLLSYWSPLFHVRYAFPYSPFFYIALAAGLIWIYRRSAVWAGLVAIVIVGAQAGSVASYYFDAQYLRDDFRGAAQFVDRNWRPGDVILLDAGYIYPGITYYLKTPVAWRGRLTEYVAKEPQIGPGATIVQTGSIGAPASLGRGDPRADFYATTETETAAGLTELTKRHTRLWLVRCYDTVTDPDGFVRDWLAEKAVLIDDAAFSGSSNMRVQGYLLAASPTSAPSPAGTVDFGGKVLLTKHALSDTTATAGEAVDVDLAWQIPTEPGVDFRAYLALKDETGRTWQQEDEKPAGRLYPSSRWPAATDIPDPRRFSIPTGTPPGHYRLVLGVYDAATGQQLDWFSDDGASHGPHYELSTLEVVRPAGTVSPPPMQKPANRQFGPITLLGYNIGVYMLKPGDGLGVELLWQAREATDADLQPHLELRDRAGKVWAQQTGSPVDGRYPTADWEKRELVRDQRDLLLAANAPDGQYALVLSLGGKETKLASVNVRGRPHVYSQPTAIPYPIRATFGPNMELIGFELTTGSGSRVAAPANDEPVIAARPDEVLHLTLFWRAHGPSEQPLTVFAQLLDTGNHLQGQHDQAPGNGDFPTTSWAEGEYLVDSYEIRVKPDVPAGELRLIVGVYNPADGSRQAVSGPNGEPLGDALPLARVALTR